MPKFWHNHDDDNDNAKPIAVPQVFSKNSRAKNVIIKTKNVLKNDWLTRTEIFDFTYFCVLRFNRFRIYHAILTIFLKFDIL